MVEFFATLIVTGSVKEAVAASGAEFEAVWLLRRLEPEFAKYWDRAVLVHRTRELEALAAGDYWGAML
jgi:hypothetical protein